MPKSATQTQKAEFHATARRELNWIFVDLNSYFASCEQEDRPELRNRPVAVVPMEAETTCCIAASYEAKAFGVKTGTLVSEARRLCPGIAFVEARHELYVEFHHRIVAAVESCLPVTAVLSIDEMACRLMGRERELLEALRLGERVKQAIRERAGGTLRCSVGLAPNRWLAKIASDMEKPDGLVALTPDVLSETLAGLELRDLPGIGARTEKRLQTQGVSTMADLLAKSREQMHELWGSVWGDRLWYWLRGEDFDLGETEHSKSLGHQHVLGPEMRSMEKAWAVALKLLHKAAMRMRKEGLWASRLSVSVGFVGKAPVRSVSAFGPGRSESWHREAVIAECQDNAMLIAVMRKLWDGRPRGRQHEQPFFVSVTLGGLVSDAEHSLTLFDREDGSEQRRELSRAMDALNRKYGMSTLAPAAMMAALKAAPTRIAFASIPEMF
jgi:DNA polymerase-4